MHRSDDRILTTHVGSLPRSAELSDLLIRDEAGEAIDKTRLVRLGEEACIMSWPSNAQPGSTS